MTNGLTLSRLVKRIAFLDRDGVINHDSSDYIKSWSEFHFLPGSIEAVKRLTLNGFLVFLITNQSAVSRGMISQKGLEYIHSRMMKEIEKGGGHIKDIFYCPHLSEDNCTCRKPEPGLIYMAQKAYNLDISSAVMVGDSSKDIECAVNAGCGMAVLVKTGNGNKAEENLKEKNIRPNFIANDLYHAVNWIIPHY
ncbi:MAG: D-glycero-beta-D-manno-heptose 1,7-bisphosphate 7-phosphatase [Deltaproteobacteria bacterium]|nr:D-glycero-beta-D-manno-heptose 1,7-bisphosphate 7-phosphatase [Deltaproteobacteria bacterium]